ncbi:MAG: Rqc2 family fibronectin-binding protein [Phototrophicaceae bacterium]|jgi:predicted ribosome quality control (RQC) complex YloA/Tae2 family protein
MAFDAFTVSALVDEFLDTIVGGRIQDSVVVDSTGIGLEIYANHRRQYLYLSADANAPRVHLIDQKLRRGIPKPTQLALLIRSKLEGGLITHVSQPPFERVIQFDLATAQDGEFQLIIEPMERRSNVILVQDGLVLDAARRVNAEDNRYRVTLPAQPYVPPPPMVGKLNPLTLTHEQMLSIFEQNKDPQAQLSRLLSARLLGMSGLLAREISYRAGVAADSPVADVDPDALYAALQAVVAPLAKREWQPGVVRQGDEKDEVKAFSVFPITHLEGWEPVASVSAAITAYYGMPSGPDGYKVAKKPIHASIQEALGREGGKLASLQSGVKDDAEMLRLRQSGDLILAYQYTLQPHQTEFSAQYDPEGEPISVRLDPTLSALENAQAYFRRYEKAKHALDAVPVLIEETENRIAYLQQLDTDLELAANWPEIDEIRYSLQQMGYWHGAKGGKTPNSGQSAPLRLVLGDGFVVWVGRNSRQNETVTFGKGGGEDYWLHVRGMPGSHVVIRFDGRTIPEAVIEQAAALAAYYSKAREEKSAIVDVTQCKYVKKIKGGAVGMVTYRNETTRNVAPQSEEDLFP